MRRADSMSQNFKINGLIFIVTLGLIVIGVSVMVSGISNDDMTKMFIGIGIITFSFITGMGIITFRVLRSATIEHRKEFKRYYGDK